MTTLKVKTKQGFVQTITVDRLIDVDGVSYDPLRASENHEQCQQNYAYLSGRIDQLERILATESTKELNQDSVLRTDSVSYAM